MKRGRKNSHNRKKSLAQAANEKIRGYLLGHDTARVVPSETQPKPPIEQPQRMDAEEMLGWVEHRANLGGSNECFLAYESHLAYTHSIISEAKKGNITAEKRFQLHGAANLLYALARARAGLDEVVFGAFPWGKALEVSLFLEDVGSVRKLFEAKRADSKNDSAIIGWGLKSQVLTINVIVQDGKPALNVDESQDFGWTDGFGTHTEYYDATEHQYVRRSKTGRHEYRLVIDPNTLVATPQPPYSAEQYPANFYVPIISN